jgi:hypothetical protein
MNTAGKRFSRQIHVDSVVDVQGVLVGTDPYRRWGPVLRWAVVVLELTPLLVVPSTSAHAFRPTLRQERSCSQLRFTR